MPERLVPQGPEDALASSEPSRQPEKLTFQESSGSLHYGRIPYEIRYDLNAPTTDVLHEKLLGNWLLTPEEPSPDSVVTMWVHESCPPQYRDIVMYHELVEAEYVLGDGIQRVDAHHLAVALTDAYAKVHLSPEEFEEYKKWERNTLGDEIIDSRSKDPASSE